MPKVGMEPIRTTALIEAVIAEIGQTGSMEVTVSQIAKRAGMSSALAHHYFGSKTNMFIAAMRHILTKYGEEIRQDLKGKTDPRARIETIIRSSFSDMNMQPDTVGAWLNFYVYAQRSGEVSRLLRVYHRRLRSNLLAELRQVIPAQAPMVAEGIAALIDGAYIRFVLCDERDRPEHPEAIVLDYLNLHLPKEQGI
ncbi:transcriptional regulator BetI [Celeribacter naphthalenivorans]|uniref:transcriptional regulator BetI n=1 Tax=Celeribacter naphthalenivorans TaxID=1614694 RepID=UPI001CF93F5A|nr:transcriptional regulator BetI [Celeribacter naphthalenivorans]